MKNQYQEIIAGETYGQLTVLCRAPDQVNSKGYKRKVWTCRCNCENETILDVREDSLKNGHTKSCGCLNTETNSFVHRKHGQEGTRLYKIWQGIKKRCYRKTFQKYNLYGDVAHRLLM